MTDFYLDLSIEPLTFYELQEKSDPLLWIELIEFIIICKPI